MVLIVRVSLQSFKFLHIRENAADLFGGLQLWGLTGFNLTHLAFGNAVIKPLFSSPHQKVTNSIKFTMYEKS